MATQLEPRERLSPALLDRLTDDAPGDRLEAETQRVMNKAQLRQAVLRDLSWLFNATQPPAHHHRVEHSAARMHPPHRFGDLVERGDPVLEEIPDTATFVGKELMRIHRLHVLAEDQHGNPWELAPELEGCPDAFVMEGRRQTHVRHDDIRPVLPHAGNNVDGVRIRPHREIARLVEQPHQALAQQHRVFDQNDAEGFGHRIRLSAPRAAPR